MFIGSLSHNKYQPPDMYGILHKLSFNINLYNFPLDKTLVALFSYSI